MSDQEAVGGEGAAVVNGTVKWFNPDKGYGFIQPADGSRDVFLHISALKRANLQDAPDGSTVVCEVEHAPKGRQVVRIIELDTSTATPRRPRRSSRPRPAGDAEDRAGEGFAARGPQESREEEEEE